MARNKECKQCGRTLFSGATVCPACGLKNPLKTAEEDGQEALAEIKAEFNAAHDHRDKQWKGEAPPDKAFWKEYAILLALGMLIVVGGLVWLTTSADSRPTAAEAGYSRAEAEADQCFAGGQASATVSIRNLSTLRSADMSLTDVRDRGCEQEFGAQGRSCVSLCKSGFTSVAGELMR